MAKALGNLLGIDGPMFSLSLHRLEQSAGRSGVDVRLIADITHKLHDVMRQLLLNPADTTARELYLALNAHLHKADAYELLLDTDYVLANIGGEIISLNLIDVIENSHHQLAFEDRKIWHGQRALRGEIFQRYTDHPRTQTAVTEDLARGAGLIDDNIVNHTPMQKAAGPLKKGNDMDKPRILAIGDINTNAFIKMNEDHGEVITDDKGYTRLSIEMGGKIPYDEVEEFRAGECSPNAAVSMARLGLDVDLMTWLGDDEAGKHMIDYLKEQGVGTDYMVVEEGQKSNYHYVLRFGPDRTKLQKFEDYSYTWREPAQVPDWIYLGVLGEKTWHLHESILDYLDRNPSVKLVFQPGMFHLMWGAEKMAEFYKKAEVVIMNREEAAQVTGLGRENVSQLIQGLHDLGVSIAVVTDGADGAYASDGSKIFFMPNYPDPAPPFERTGAGDAFASTLSAALALGESLESALRWAPINSAYVVQQMGAQKGLLMYDELKGYLSDAPEWYKATEFEG